jgi:hypothetical protein
MQEEISSTDYSKIEIGSFGRLNFLVTDPEGRKTGFDIVSSRSIKNIPNSEYYFDEPYNNFKQETKTLPEDFGIQWALIRSPLDGEYQITLIGQPGQQYSFAVYQTTKNGKTNLQLIEGHISSNQNEVYNLQFSSDKEDSIFIEKVKY